MNHDTFDIYKTFKTVILYLVNCCMFKCICIERVSLSNAYISIEQKSSNALTSILNTPIMSFSFYDKVEKATSDKERILAPMLQRGIDNS